jgi:predicted DsbA family dithiol-disulfide isomerase
MTPLRIDIVSDVVCPWCAIGYYQLVAALKRSGEEAEIHWHPFELHPDMAEGGEDYVAYLAAKYGITPEQVAANRERLTAMGAEVGFTFNYGEGMRTYNSFAAHRLIRRADASGRAQAAKLALFRAFFTEGRAIDRTEVLLDVAEEIGLDRDEAEAGLASPEIASEVRAIERNWTSQGLTGVPAMVFDSRHLVSGAQGVEAYGRILETVRQHQTA